MTCPRKDIGRAVGYVSLKPTVVAAGLSGSAKGVVHPFPHRAERQRHEGICPGYGTDTGDGILLGGVRTRAIFLLLHLIFVDVWAQLWPSSSRYHKFLWH